MSETQLDRLTAEFGTLTDDQLRAIIGDKSNFHRSCDAMTLLMYRHEKANERPIDAAMREIEHSGLPSRVKAQMMDSLMGGKRPGDSSPPSQCDHPECSCHPKPKPATRKRYAPCGCFDLGCLECHPLSRFEREAEERMNREDYRA